MIKFDIWSNKFAATNKQIENKKLEKKIVGNNYRFGFHIHTHTQTDRQTDRYTNARISLSQSRTINY